MTKQEDKRFMELLNRFFELTPEEDKELHALAQKNMRAIYNSVENYFFEVATRHPKPGKNKP